jgi:hypothetical protein
MLGEAAIFRRVLMNKLAAFLAILWLSTGIASAQSGYVFSTPPGWQQAATNGAVVLAPTNNPSQTAIVLLPVQPLTNDFNGQFNLWQTMLEQTFKLSQIQVTQPARTQSNGADYIMAAGKYSSGNGQRTLVFFARAENGVFGMGVFMTAPENVNVQQEVGSFMSTLGFSADAAQIATNNMANSQAAAQTQPQPQTEMPDNPPQQQMEQQEEQESQSQKNESSAKKVMYESCLQHCQQMSMMCSMGGGHYFGGNNWQSGRPCLSELTGCQVNCGVYK